MNRKIVYLTAFAFIIIVGIAAAAFFIYRPHTNPANNAPISKNPPILGTLTADTPTSLTITLQDTTPKTFSVSSTTQVITQVSAGVVGKSLSDIAVGTQVLVQPHALNSLVADGVTVMPLPVTLNQNPAGPPFFITGTILSTTTSSVTIKTATDPSVRVTLTKDTAVFSNVLTGETGKSLFDLPKGTYVQVVGFAGGKGPTAVSVQLLIPLGQ